MNKTLNVNIGGIVFHIDENAYERFKSYLESIRHHFTASEGRDEIMQDIEARIAEMFQDRVKDKQVVTLQDVEEVTKLMGKPEQFGDEPDHEEPIAGEVPTGKIARRLYRNPDDKLVGGVCSGVAAYFDVDAVWVRLVFAVVCFPIFFSSFFGSGILLYILLWFIIPEASSTTEKLQMKGEPVNISSIEKNVTEEREQKSKSGTFVSRFFSMLGQIIRFSFNLIGKLFAVFFLFIGVVISFAVFVSLLALLKIPGTHYPIIVDHIFPGGSYFGWGLLGAVLTIGIPFLMLAYFGAKMLFNVKKYSRGIGLTALSLWLLGVFLCAFIGVRTAREFSQKQNVSNVISLIQPASKKLNLEIASIEGERQNNRYWNDDDNSWEDDIRLSFQEDQLQSRNIKIDILKSPTDSFKLEELFYARGSSRKDAADHASRISYGINQSDSVLKFNPYFTIDKDEKYRAQKIQLVLYVPEGGVIYLDPTLKKYIYDIENNLNILDRDMLGRTWKMTGTGLICMDCTGKERTLGDRTFDYSDDGDVDIKGPDGSRVRIDNNGVFIKGPQNETVRIDSNGVVIENNGKKKIIKKKKRDY